MLTNLSRKAVLLSPLLLPAKFWYHVMQASKGLYTTSIDVGLQLLPQHWQRQHVFTFAQQHAVPATFLWMGGSAVKHQDTWKSQ